MAKTILLAVDINNEETSKAPLAAALDLAHDGGVIHVVCVVPDFGLPQVSGFFPEGYEQKMLHKFGEEKPKGPHQKGASQFPVGTPASNCEEDFGQRRQKDFEKDDKDSANDCNVAQIHAGFLSAL